MEVVLILGLPHPHHQPATAGPTACVSPSCPSLWTRFLHVGCTDRSWLLLLFSPWDQAQLANHGLSCQRRARQGLGCECPYQGTNAGSGKIAHVAQCSGHRGCQQNHPEDQQICHQGPPCHVGHPESLTKISTYLINSDKRPGF